MGSKANLHRETPRAALRVIQTAEALEPVRIRPGRPLNVFDKLEAQGLRGDAAVAEAEGRLTITRAPEASAADERPVRRRGPGRAGRLPHRPGEAARRNLKKTTSTHLLIIHTSSFSCRAWCG
jgi:hypothetical protein